MKYTEKKFAFPLQSKNSADRFQPSIKDAQVIQNFTGADRISRIFQPIRTNPAFNIRTHSQAPLTFDNVIMQGLFICNDLYISIYQYCKTLFDLLKPLYCIVI